MIGFLQGFLYFKRLLNLALIFYKFTAAFYGKQKRLNSFLRSKLFPSASLKHPLIKTPLLLECSHLHHFDTCKASKVKLLQKNNSFFVRDYKFFIRYSFGALYCYQKIGCFKKVLGTIQFFIFNHSDLGDFFNFFWGFFVIFRNVWKTYLAFLLFTLHSLCVRLRYLLFGEEIIDVCYCFNEVV